MMLIALIAGCLSGLIVGLFVEIAEIPYMACALAVSIFIVFSKTTTKALLAALFLLAFGGGYWRSSESMQPWQVQKNKIGPISGDVVVASSPEAKDTLQEVEVSFVSCEGICPENKVLLFLPTYTAFHYGDRIRLHCDLIIPKSENDFDYRMYLASRGIEYTCFPKKWEVVDSGHGNFIIGYLLGMREQFERKIDNFVTYPESGLVKGLLLGGNNYLTKEWRDMFSSTGMSHIVAVSGSNIALVGQYLFFLFLLLGLWRKQALIASIVGIVFFIIMIGLPASAVRAGIMGCLVLAARLHGRISHSIRLLFIAAVGMLLWNPLWFRYDLGFQLSFMASLGILLLTPISDAWRRNVKNGIAGHCIDIMGVTLAAEICILPIILYNFHSLPLGSLITNMIILLIIPWIMLLGVLVVLCGYMSLHSIAWFFGLSAYFLSHLVLLVIWWFAHTSWLLWTFHDVSIWFALFWYVVIGIGLIFFYKKSMFRSTRI